MLWPHLTQGTLVQRYKRFLADVDIDQVGRVTAHCPNTGSMLRCSEPGRPVYLSHHQNPRRKHKWTWELIDMGSSLVGVNTQNTNRIWAEALQNRSISEFGRYDTFQPEVKLDPNTRLDFLLTGSDVPPMYVEVKNCTLVQDKAAAFPDAVTARGQKHIKALRAVHDSGMQAALVFVVQRTDARFFHPAHWIDPEYARLLAQAARQGVMVKAYDVVMDTSRITINRDLPVVWE